MFEVAGEVLCATIKYSGFKAVSNGRGLQCSRSIEAGQLRLSRDWKWLAKPVGRPESRRDRFVNSSSCSRRNPAGCDKDGSGVLPHPSSREGGWD